ncbi:MAG: hypothetical protein NBKEAIPA_01734 [Nitrospirae bacterium]|nr:hypothetical protein [Nitrospirota bacterium]
MQGDQAADAGEGEAQADGNRREAFGGQQKHEREALAAVGQTSGEQPQGLDGERLGQLQLQHPAVFGPLGIEAQEPAAGHPRRRNRQAQAGRRFEAK